MRGIGGQLPFGGQTACHLLARTLKFFLNKIDFFDP